MPSPTTGELKIMISNLDKTVKTGFDGVHKRQDVTNGKVIDNTEFRISTRAQFRVWKYIVALVGLSNIGFILNTIL